jgi:flagellar biogenesis protein FliO
MATASALLATDKTTPTTTTTDTENKLSTGVIAAIVFGVVILITLIIISIAWAMKSKQNARITQQLRGIPVAEGGGKKILNKMWTKIKKMFN